jgi:hypothetical protein
MGLVDFEDEVEARSQTVRFEIKDYRAVFKARNLETILLDFKRHIRRI